jgi:hypothetical protein
MSELENENEVQIELKEDETAEVAEPERELTEVEKAAKAKGWNPKGPKSAEKWEEDAPLYEQIKKLKKAHKEKDKKIDYLVHLSKEQLQNASKQTIKELQTQKLAAIEEGNVKQVQQLEQQQEQVKASQEAAQYVNEFVERNSDWYKGTSHQHLKMIAACKDMDQKLGSETRNGVRTIQQHMEALENYMHGEFPDYFNSLDADDELDEDNALQRPKANAVESGVGSQVSAQRGRTFKFADLNHVQKQVWGEYKKINDNNARSGKEPFITLQQYLTGLAKRGEIK